jgi:hypothetical protein
MVDPYKVRDMLRQRPFQPFRVHVKDGRVFDIRFPKINMVLKDYFDIGIPVPNDPDPIYQSVVSVPWEEIDKIEFLSQTPGPIWVHA